MSCAFPVTRRGALTVLAAATAGPALAIVGSDAPHAEALHLLNRLAFGPAPGDLERVARIGVDAWVAEQLEPERLPLPGLLADQLAALGTIGQTQRALIHDYREAQREAREAKRAEPASPEPTDATAELRQRVALIQHEAAAQRLLQALNSPRQLQEVLVDFWFNHFNVFQGKGLDRVLIESYEREAIRPHVLGRFRTMLGATARHPAMLFYLDNWLSVAPGWQPRHRPGDMGGAPARPSGLNENYARELMELHTLGVDGGYTQQDVTELARIFTGWTIMPQQPLRQRPGARRFSATPPAGDSAFVFDPSRHDIGTKRWLGRTMAPAGEREGEAALDALAQHPATATHIAFKLARRFVADTPPQPLVDRLARRFQRTDGDLRAVMQELIDSAEFRHAGQAKFKTPYQFVLSAVRASGIATTNVRPLVAQLARQGQPLYGCQTPDGWRDTEADWLNPGALSQRLNFVTMLASGALPLQRNDSPDSQRVDAAAVLATLGPAISDKTRAAIAESPPAMRAAMILGSPDFMRR